MKGKAFRTANASIIGYYWGDEEEGFFTFDNKLKNKWLAQAGERTLYQKVTSRLRLGKSDV